jgi:hypothetical protein
MLQMICCINETFSQEKKRKFSKASQTNVANSDIEL